MSNKKSLKFPVASVVYIVVSFLLGLLDMTLLYKIVGPLMGLDNAMAMFVAFLLATIANFTALTWGKANGDNMAEKSINKHSVGSFIAWVFIGIVYLAIRIAGLFLVSRPEGTSDINYWVGQILTMSILAISYIGTGVLIASSSRTIWDREAKDMRRLTKEFNQAHDDLAKATADLDQNISILSKYHLNYPSLERQYKKIESAIYRAEDATMSDIVGKVVAAHPEINPREAHNVKDEIMEKRKKNEEKKNL